MKQIKHISFDLWGTLITSNPKYAQLRTNLLADIFGVEANADLVRSAKIQSDRISEYTGIQVQYSHIIASAIANKLNLVDHNNFMANVAKFKLQNHKLVLNNLPVLIESGVPFILEAIKSAGVTMSVLSNTSFITGNTMRQVLEAHNIAKYFKFMLFSDEMGYAKPNVLVYNKIFQGVNANFEEILHVGDNPFADKAPHAIQSYIVSKQQPLANLLNLL